MRQFLTKAAAAIALVLIAGPVFADHRQPNYGYDCFCQELQRRTRGLTIAAQRAPMSQYERDQVNREAWEGDRYLSQAQYTHDQNERDRICSQGNQAVNYSWVRWQPWLARMGYDHPTSCEGGYPGGPYPRP